ncbi:MAG: hypothetical protein M1820_003915 [Bogoriella megaspora]|nr:MAG: hypothetical protein M1820_003915 [Bogoriella megaspora]
MASTPSGSVTASRQAVPYYDTSIIYDTKDFQRGPFSPYGLIARDPPSITRFEVKRSQKRAVKDKLVFLSLSLPTRMGMNSANAIRVSPFHRLSLFLFRFGAQYRGVGIVVSFGRRGSGILGPSNTAILSTLDYQESYKDNDGSDMLVGSLESMMEAGMVERREFGHSTPEIEEAVHALANAAVYPFGLRPTRYIDRLVSLKTFYRFLNRQPMHQGIVPIFFSTQTLLGLQSAEVQARLFQYLVPKLKGRSHINHDALQWVELYTYHLSTLVLFAPHSFSRTGAVLVLVFSRISGPTSDSTPNTATTELEAPDNLYITLSDVSPIVIDPEDLRGDGNAFDSRIFDDVDAYSEPLYQHEYFNPHFWIGEIESWVWGLLDLGLIVPDGMVTIVEKEGIQPIQRDRHPDDELKKRIEKMAIRPSGGPSSDDVLYLEMQVEGVLDQVESNRA